MKELLMCLMLAGVLGAADAPRFAVHGHRGATVVRPENTIPSFQEAIRAGADFVELDTAVTRDNVLVVSHDPAINLNICKGPGGKRVIREMTLDEVRGYDCGSLTLPAFPRQTAVPGTRIPTLDEVLDLAKSSAIKFNIEIKSDEKNPQYAPEPKEYAGMVVAAVRRHRLENRVLMQSFDFRVVKAVRAIAPELATAALYSRADRSFTDIARENGVNIVTPAFALVTPEKVKQAHDAGIQIVPWTPDSVADWDRLIDAGVDGIITNDPAGLIAHLKQRGLR